MLSPISDDGAVGVMVDGVFFPFASKSTVAVEFLPEPPACTPPAKNGVPAGEADPGGHVLHNVLKVVDAPVGVDPRPAEKIPFGQVFPEPFLHVEGGELS